jgi:uncharacterized cupredoxin-like copper-binding protein
MSSTEKGVHMTPSKAVTAVAVLSLAAAIAAGCGDDDDETATQGATATGAETETAATAGEPVETVEVSETEYELDPADPEVSERGPIEFEATNDGEEVHALEVEGSSGESETETIDPGDSATLTVDLEPGEYTWYCPVGNHRELGMEGTITVAGGSGGSESDDDVTGEAEPGASESGDDGGGY